MAQILPGVDEYLSRGIKNLGNVASRFFETDRDTERAIRNMLVEKPELVQEFADLEARDPGALKRLGFGRMADMVIGTPESSKQSIDRATRGSQFRTSVAGAELQANTAEGIIKLLRDAGLNEDFIRTKLGLPTQFEEEKQTLEKPVLQRNANVASKLNEFQQGAEHATNPIGEYVDLFIEGKDDTLVTQSLLADPLTSAAFKMYYDMKMTEKGNEARQKGEATKIGDLPAAVQSALVAIAPARAALKDYSEKVNTFMAAPFMQRAADAVALGKRQEALGNIRALKSGLMGTLRPLLSPGPLSAADIRMIDNMLSNVLSLAAFARGPDYVKGQLDGALEYLEYKISGFLDLYPNVEIPGVNRNEGTGVSTNTSTTGTTDTTTNTTTSDTVTIDEVVIPKSVIMGLIHLPNDQIRAELIKQGYKVSRKKN